jgi:hypothetical protein
VGRREYERNEYGFKPKIQLRVDGEVLERMFRSEGEARKYLEREYGFNKNEINRRVKFLRS